ncbi:MULTISPECIES: multidrug effflux MFS transporter [Brucella]|uniref:Bcr/CflA family efflux transporter n=2 Tax=Brucella suis TaxID=29461 RepID=A0AAI8H6A9_BRUSS|nr:MULTISPECIES: multidrug effflux MFS transporter [Brucella]AAN29762.1 drug resistance transporter, Bcr/CflA family [Brucella suis 1330]AEM18179.1 Bcr/CflA subfamily drug resistance transporter [Brucella suis 1330]AEU05847.1 Bcr/CflA subfamily drug resistance transporter [Brucella suis VBI22]AHN46471.1 Bcr/CflA subfamily drug resistance transporter [Brucella suis bv. 1 str. S2]AIN84093.1 major facilitator transporter [Brucella suis]
MPLDIKDGSPSHQTSIRGRGEFIALIAAIMAINALAVDIMLPGLPQIGASLGVHSENHVQFVITAYLLGFGVSQLFYGPLSDRFGRRLPLFGSLAIYVVAALGSAFVTDFTTLIILRVLQGLGAAATRVIAVSVVRDKFSGRQMAEVMSLVMMVFMILPVVAPATGQLIMLFGEWHLIFMFMAIMALVVGLWAFLRLPETLPVSRRRPLTMKSTLGGFVIVLTNRVALFYMLGTSFILGALFGYINSAQQIFVGIYQLGTLFPLAFAAVAMTLALASFLNSRLVGRFGMRRISQTMLLVFTSFSLLWMVLSIVMDGPIPFAVLMIIYMTIMLSFSLVTANFNALAMEPLGEVAGTASSVLGFAQTVIGAALGAVIGQAFDGTTTPVATGYCVLGFVALACVLIAERGRLFRVQNPPAEHVI